MEKIIKELEELNSFFTGLKELAIKMNEVEKLLGDVKTEEKATPHHERVRHKKRRYRR